MAIAYVLLCASAFTGRDTETNRVDFNFQIRPLLSDRCYRCHGPDSGSRKAKLRLDTREGALKELEGGMAVVKPGDLEHSELIRRIQSTDSEKRMPPPDAGAGLLWLTGAPPRSDLTC